MRWSGQSVTATRERQSALPGLGLAEMAAMPGHLRTVRSPDFKGMVFHEVLAKSALNKVPGASSMPFSWTVNPYRGCSHACVYCFARGSHRYLDLDAGKDFDSQIVVKVNVAEVLSRELLTPSWQGEYVALGTNTDPYQRAEGRYALMPGIIDALGRSNTRSRFSPRARCCGATSRSLPNCASGSTFRSPCRSRSLTTNYSNRSSPARRARGHA